jgi:acetylornithine deacetylase/succinyl-diaminopimelate desuccinylase-like protein
MKMVNGAALAEWVARLVSIPSVGPDFTPSRPEITGEARLATAVGDWFRRLGGEVYRDEVYPDRWNVIGVWRGASDHWAALDVHLDTVSVEQMTSDPFARRIEQGRVWGRGAVDTKASLGIALAILEDIQTTGRQLGVNLVLVGTVDEEMMGGGAAAFPRWVRRQGLQLDTLMVAEPTVSTPVHSHKGASRVEVVVHGRASHSSQPHLGQNAITGAAQLILALDEEHKRIQAQPAKTALGQGTISVTLIEGGVGLNIIPDTCRFSIDRRTVAGESTAEVTQGLRDLVQRVSSLPAEVNVIREYESFYQEPDSPWLRQLVAWSGQTPTVAPYGTNAWAYGGLARECIVMGPGDIAQAHGAEEWIEISELEKMARVYEQWWRVT